MLTADEAGLVTEIGATEADFYAPVLGLVLYRLQQRLYVAMPVLELVELITNAWADIQAHFAEQGDA